jgi:hypothetical protein
MLQVIPQLWVFSRFISEMQSSTAAPEYRQRRRKRRNLRTRWLPPADKTPEKKNVRGTLLQAEEAICREIREKSFLPIEGGLYDLERLRLASRLWAASI